MGRMRFRLSKRAGWLISILAVAFLLLVPDCTRNYGRYGLAYRGATAVDHAQLLVDETWVDETGERHVQQEIFDSVFDIIDNADQFLLLDFFLVNDFLYEPGPGLRPLSQELADRLIAKRKADPDVPVVFISDPVNTVYGSLESPQFKALQDAGVVVVWTDLDRLRDSNSIYSRPWRLFVRRWGTAPGDALKNPMGEGTISMRSMLKLLNFKANHRKVIVSEKSLLVTSANPHSASSAHWNVALRFDGAGMPLALESEAAVLRLSGAGGIAAALPTVADAVDPQTGNTLELLTEGRIKEKVVDVLASAEPGARIDLGMFYLSQRETIKALLDAQKRGCNVRVILDPNKDAFGRTKNGIPNRQTALRLVRAGIPLRWADTHGEQFHVKMLYAEQPGDAAVLLLGSCNYSRRNTDNFNAECDAAVTGPLDDPTMAKARDTFDRWWSNPEGRLYTVDYPVYADPSLWRRLQALLMERTGLSSF